MIQLINIRKLAYRLANRQVSDKEQMLYLLVFTLISSVSSMYVVEKWQTHDPVTQATWFTDIISTFFELAIVCAAYGVNQKGDGQEFIARFICLSVPLTLRTFVIVMAMSYIVGTFLPLPTDFLVPLIMVLTYVYVYWLMMKYMRIAAGGQKA